MILKQGLYRIDVIFLCATVSARDQNHGNVNTKAKLWVKFFFALLFLYHSDWYSCNLLILMKNKKSKLENEKKNEDPSR